MLQKHVTSLDRIIGRLNPGDDLLEGLTERCRIAGVRLGKVEAIGAVEKARIGFYDQQKREYFFNELAQPLEILALKGNVSLRDGEIMIHAHVTLGDRKGRAFGGHLAPGTVVFACEYLIEPMAGAEFHRGYDEPTGLPLWQENLSE